MRWSAWLDPNHGGFHEANQNQPSDLGRRRSRGRDDRIDRMAKRHRFAATSHPWRFHDFGVEGRRRRGTWTDASGLLRSRAVLRRQIHRGYCRGVGSKQRRDGRRDTDCPGLRQAATSRAGGAGRPIDRSGASARRACASRVAPEFPVQSAAPARVPPVTCPLGQWPSGRSFRAHTCRRLPGRLAQAGGVNDGSVGAGFARCTMQEAGTA